jgi:hypothetical protein
MWHRRDVRVATSSLLAAAASALALAATSAGASPPAGKWLTWNAHARTASLVLVAGYDGSNNGFNFDGYGRGRLLVRIPTGWRVTVTCRNAASMRHSCAIVRGPRTAAPAFRGASTPSPLLGLRSGKTARFTFTASRPGTYRIACLVPGHEDARMWDVFVVGGVKRPSISTRTGF